MLALSSGVAVSQSEPNVLREIVFLAEGAVDVDEIQGVLNSLLPDFGSVVQVHPLTYAEEDDGGSLLVQGESLTNSEHPLVPCQFLPSVGATTALRGPLTAIQAFVSALGISLEGSGTTAESGRVFNDAQTTDFDDGPNGFPPHPAQAVSPNTWYRDVISISADTMNGNKSGNYVLIVDTGLTIVPGELGNRYIRPALADDFRHQIPGNNESANVGHGTAIAVLAVGTGSGIARHATVVSRDACGVFGECTATAVWTTLCSALEDTIVFSSGGSDEEEKWYGRLVINISLVAYDRNNAQVNQIGLVLQSAIDHGAVVVAAAGNDGACVPGGNVPNCHEAAYPAAFGAHPGHIAVAAVQCDADPKVDGFQEPTNRSDCTYADFSTPGSYVDIAAPGHRLTSHTGEPNKNDYFSWYGGTSFSAAIVSGAVAAIRSHFNDHVPPAMVGDCLKSSATTSIGTGNPPLPLDEVELKIGKGLLRVDEALACVKDLGFN